MVAIARPQRLTLPLPLAGAIGGGGLVALAFLLMPSSILARLVSASGIPAILAAAEPPLGLTARIALALAFGGLVAGFAWFGLHLTEHDHPIDLSRLTGWLRRGDVHPDAPPRPPLFANRDLGTPFLDVKAVPDPTPEAPLGTETPLVFNAPPVERDLPVDLDQPLASFDPAAILAVPMAPPEPIVPLIRPQLIDPGDRFETFEMTPVQRVPPRSVPLSLRVPPANSLRTTSLREDVVPIRAEPTPVITPRTESTVHALLARLERGVAGREVSPPPAPSTSSGRASPLQDTLGDLRRLATGAR